MTNSEWLTLKFLGERFIWVAPVGVRELRGWMVCRRVMNNPAGTRTRVEYLRNPFLGAPSWKKPFRECEHLFPTLDAALKAAAEWVGKERQWPGQGKGASQPNLGGGRRRDLASPSPWHEGKRDACATTEGEPA